MITVTTSGWPGVLWPAPVVPAIWRMAMADPKGTTITFWR